MVRWEEPRYSNRRVNRAGRALAEGTLDPRAEDRTLQILNNWRSAHSFPLNTFQVTLRRKAQRIYQHALVAQRLKRTSSILRKLRRFDTMNLTQMQDIGGCRAVLLNVRQARRLYRAYLESGLKHELVNRKNYIDNPKESGYRSIHLIYEYFSDRRDTWNGLLIEVQIRSRIQHSWATAVETVGTFIRRSLKSSEGPERWLRFFSLTGSAFAGLEGTARVPGTPDDDGKLIEEIREAAENLELVNKLKAYRMALRTLDMGRLGEARYYLLDLRPAEERLFVTGFKKAELDEATEAYLEVEKEVKHSPGAEAVLVSADSVSALKRAYPNYFLDTENFLKYLEDVLDGKLQAA